MKILLLGYMASGKSVIGKHLASRLHLPFYDLDTYIEGKENKSVSCIFKEQGEIYFRLKEHEYLKELLSKTDNFILSLGGGTPCYANNMEYIIKDKGVTSVYLKSSIENLVARLSKNKSKRPLIANFSDEKLTEFVAKHIFERKFYYEKAKYRVSTDNKSIQEIITELQILFH